MSVAKAVHVAFRRDTVDRDRHLLSALAGERRIHIPIGVDDRAGDGVHVFGQQTADLQGDGIAGCAVLTHLQATDFGGLRHPNAHARGAAHQDRSQRAVEYGEGTAFRHRAQRLPASSTSPPGRAASGVMESMRGAFELEWSDLAIRIIWLALPVYDCAAWDMPSLDAQTTTNAGSRAARPGQQAGGNIVQNDAPAVGQRSNWRTGKGLVMSKRRKRTSASSACGQSGGQPRSVSHWPATSSMTTWPGSSRPLSRAATVAAGMPMTMAQITATNGPCRKDQTANPHRSAQDGMRCRKRTHAHPQQHRGDRAPRPRAGLQQPSAEEGADGPGPQGFLAGCGCRGWPIVHCATGRSSFVSSFSCLGAAPVARRYPPALPDRESARRSCTRRMAHLPRSIMRQRSLQKGEFGSFCGTTVMPQMGQRRTFRFLRLQS